MSDQMEYKCPACGGSLAFDSDSQKLKCPYCDSTFDLNQFEASAETEGQSAEGFDDMNWNVRAGSEWEAGEEDGMSILSCNSCGGEIVCEDTTIADSCPYCGSPVVLKGRLSGMLKPDYIIPFKLDKKDAKEAFRKHVSSKKLVPEIFKNKRHIDEIKGVYVPFWLFDASVDADISYRGERTRVWTDREYRYEEHNYYSIFRSGNVVFDNVPVDGSKKMPDDLMESLEPYDFKEAVDFKSAYLAGFMADRYDVGVQESIEKVNMRIKMSTEEMFLSTVDGLGNVLTERSYIRLNNGIAKYALYPVWLLNTKWEGNIYTFAMNGQTGKFIGDLPLDKRAFWRKFGVLAGIFSVVGCVLSVLVDYLLI